MRIYVASKVKPHPFIKWVGGKRQLLAELEKHVPASYGTYHEPFLGGGALYFHLLPKRAILSDANARLVRTYRAVQSDVEELIHRLRGHAEANSEEHFYAERARKIDVESDVELAAWFIYLNKTGFNGLYRVNRKNQFNVPYGRYENPAICDADNLRACGEALQTAQIEHCDFREACKRIEPGDFAYFDPPYVPLSLTSSFASYTADGFGSDEQAALSVSAERLLFSGAHVLLSNSSAPLVGKLYEAYFEVQQVSAKRAINCKAASRGAIKESLIYPRRAA